MSGWGITDVFNSVGGNVFKNSTYGKVITKKTSPVNVNSIPQQVVRALFGAIAKQWATLTVAQQTVWRAEAPGVSRINKLGNNMPLTAPALFYKLNNNLSAAGEANITDWPGQPAVISLDPLDIVADTTGGTLEINFTPPIPADQKFIVYASPGLSSGLNSAGTSMRQIDVLGSADLTGIDVAAEYIGKIGGLPLVGEKVFIEVRPVHTPDGFSGVISSGSDIAV